MAPDSPSITRTAHTTNMRMRAVALAAVAGTCAAIAGQASAQPAGVVCATPTAQYGLPASAPVYGLPAEIASPQGDPNSITLTRTQLLINQRISQAALRRLAAVQKWLDDGIVATDICGGALGPEDLGGMTVRSDPPQGTKPAPTPRALVFPPARTGNPSAVRVTRTQLLINQRISQAAIRRAAALRARLSTGLTGGDIADGTLTRSNLRLGLVIVAAPLVANPPARTRTVVAPPQRGNPAAVTLTRRQLLINQRISQAGVRRANALIAKVRTGLNGNDFQANTVTGVDLAPGTVGD